MDRLLPKLLGDNLRTCESLFTKRPSSRIVIIFSTFASAAYRSMTITVVVDEEISSHFALLNMVFHRLSNEFGLRVKHVPKTEDKCSAYANLAKKYAPLRGQTMLIIIPFGSDSFNCKKREEGNVVLVWPYLTVGPEQGFAYGQLEDIKENYLSGAIFGLIQYIDQLTTVSSMPSYEYGTSDLFKKKKTGLFVPGYLALILSVGTVIAFAVAVHLCVKYRKKSVVSSVGLFDIGFSSGDAGRGSEERLRKKKKKKKDKTAKTEELPKVTSQESVEQLAPFIAKGRSTDELLENPVNAPEFLFYLHRLARLVIEYFDDPKAFSVTTDLSPGFLYRTMSRFAPPTPEKFQVICDDLKRKILPGMTHWQHPRFHAYYPAGRRFPDVLAEVLTSAMAFNVFSWESCPSLSELENLVVNWIGRAFGLPEEFLFQESLQKSPGGGSIVGSASDAIFCSIMVSRNWKISQVRTQHRDMGSSEYETIHDILKKLVVYCSKDAHSGIEKACRVAMVRCRPIQPRAENGWGITGEQLEKCIVADIKKGLIPTHIHCTLGTSATGAEDLLDSIWPIAEKYDMWLHCDASFSGNAWIDEKYRANTKSLAHVHSLNVNLHKFLLFSGMTCLVWTRFRHIYKDAFNTASFQNFPLQDTTDMRDWGIHVSRRNKALKIWMSVRLNGLEGLRYYLNYTVEMCNYFESLVAKHPLLKIFSRRLAFFTFYYEEPGSSKEENNKYTEDLCQFINQSHMLFVAPTRVHDINLIRICISYERTDRGVVDESWNILKNLVDEFTNRKNDPYLLQTKMVAPIQRYRRPARPSRLDYAIPQIP